MSPSPPIHPTDALTRRDKCKIYYSRIVALAVVGGLLTPDPETEIGHFAFSAYYRDGKELDRALHDDLVRFEQDYPQLVLERRARLDQPVLDAVEAFQSVPDEEKIRDLIVLGASHLVWPTGTSFTLTYPWDLNGEGRPVRFRPDLSDFMKRRIIQVLKKAGKLRTPNLFEPEEDR